METNEGILNNFTTRMRQLVLQYKENLRECGRLRAEIGEKEGRILELEETVRRLESRYESLKTAKMLEITDGDVEKARARVSKLLRDVNKCITYLNEK